VGKSNLRPGTIEEFFGWINERHKIYERRASGESRPWTRDIIMRDYKFTNVFRELDRGTVMLREQVSKKLGELTSMAVLTLEQGYELEVLNTVLYRMINWVGTFEDCGFIGVGKTWEDSQEFSPAEHFEAWIVKARDRERRGDKVFTSAHMTVGKAGCSKLDTVIETMWEVIGDLQDHATNLRCCTALSEAAEYIQAQKWYGVGPFINYEIVSDLRWSLLDPATDKLTWANIGPGCKRGLLRLELPVELESLRKLHEMAPAHLKKHVMKHYGPDAVWPPFELREIEHSLCEFDKLSRARHGTGRPKENFNGRGT
jgi:hypothetical protein